MTCPLPLTPFEQYMLEDDRPNWPMNILLRLQFSGTFARPAFEAAVQASLRRHPLLAAKVEPAGRKRLAWSPASGAPSCVHWTSACDGDSRPAFTPIDLGQEPGLRLRIMEAEETTELWCQCHHACCDGLGLLQFVQDLLVAYAAPDDELPELAPPALAHERLRARGWYGLTPGQLVRLLPRQLVGLLGVRQFFAHTPSPLVPGDIRPTAPEASAGGPAFLVRQLTGEESASLHRVARGLRVTLNDLLLRDWFLAAAAWRRERFPGTEQDWLRLTVPINLRTEATREMPATNQASMVFLDRRPCDCADSGRLLEGIHREMEQIKRCRLGLTFMASVALARALGGLTRMVRGDRCAATAILTNLGVFLSNAPLTTRDGRLVAGNVVLEDIDMLAPLRPYTYAAFSVLTYASQLRIAVHYDPCMLGAREAEALLDAFLTQLRNSAGLSEKVSSKALSGTHL
jgi:NRPS condensation-like uncharacterized protein